MFADLKKKKKKKSKPIEEVKHAVYSVDSWTIAKTSPYRTLPRARLLLLPTTKIWTLAV